MSSTHVFSLRLESELIVWCARTTVPERLHARIRQRVQERLDWKHFLQLVSYHGVTPLVFRTLSAMCPELVPREALDELRRKSHARILLNRALAQELAEVCQAFKEQGVEAIALKGAPLALSAYQDLGLREFDDLDLVVPKVRLADAHAVLQSVGFRPLSRSREEFQSSHFDEPYHAYVKDNRPLPVDLQWVMAHQHFMFRLDRPEFWQRRVPMTLANKTVQVLEPEDLLIVLCVHGSKHAWEQLKWVCDVAELLRSHPSLQWDRIVARAVEWRCRRLLSLGLEIARRVLDAPLPPAVAESVSADSDMQRLVSRMPATLLAHIHEGVKEEQAVALYFTLKDSWLERWRFGLVLCRDESPVVSNPPHWFRWRLSLAFLAQLVRPFQWIVRSLLPRTIRDTLNRSADKAV